MKGEMKKFILVDQSQRSRRLRQCGADGSNMNVFVMQTGNFSWPLVAALSDWWPGERGVIALSAAPVHRIELWGGVVMSTRHAGGRLNW